MLTIATTVLIALVATSAPLAPVVPGTVAVPTPGPEIFLATQQAAAPQPAVRVNINTASTEQLQAIPGVGPATAERIIQFRQGNGTFERVEDLLNIRGIGESTLEKMRPYIKLTDDK